MKIDSKKISSALEKAGYCSTPRIDTALWATLTCEKPMIIEGDPGVGKTSLTKALAKGLGMPFIRVQMYEGLTDDKILYDYDYQKQLLVLESIKSKLNEQYEELSLEDSIKLASESLDFYGDDFLIKRPVLRAITSPKRCVLLFDEIDKAPEEIEYMLYEFLEDFSITIPQYGEITCPKNKKPLVFLTSNGYRDLSGALRRRCGYLYIDRKNEADIYNILKSRSSASDAEAQAIAACLVKMQTSGLRQEPSISEAIDLATFISDAKKQGHDVTRDVVLGSLGMLSKNSKDRKIIERIVDQNGEVLWDGD